MWHLFLTEFLPPASHILPLQFSPIAEVEEEEEEIEGKKLELSQTKRVSPRYTEWSGRKGGREEGREGGEREGGGRMVTG